YFGQLSGRVDEGDFFQGFEIFDHELERDRTVLGGDGVADLLGVAIAVDEVGDLIGVFLTATPQAFEIEKSGDRDAGRFDVFPEIIVAKDGGRALDFGLAFESPRAWSLGLLFRGEVRPERFPGFVRLRVVDKFRYGVGGRHAG